MSLTFAKNICESFPIIIVLGWCSKVKFIAMPIILGAFYVKEHGIKEVIPSLFAAGKNFGRDCSPKFKI